MAAEELPECKEEVTLQFLARKLDKKDFFGKSDPFLKLFKTTEQGTPTLVHKTEVSTQFWKKQQQHDNLISDHNTTHNFLHYTNDNEIFVCGWC